MSLSDDVRKYCLEKYILPARKDGNNTVIIRVGDIHKELNFKDKIPLVCSSIGTNKFKEMAKVERVSIEGPIGGAETFYTFKIL